MTDIRHYALRSTVLASVPLWGYSFLGNLVHTLHTCTAAYLDRYSTHLVRVLRTLVSWCERVCLPGVLLIVIRRSRHGRVVRWALGPGPREPVARPAHGECARQRAWTQ